MPLVAVNSVFVNFTPLTKTSNDVVRLYDILKVVCAAVAVKVVVVLREPVSFQVTPTPVDTKT